MVHVESNVVYDQIFDERCLVVQFPDEPAAAGVGGRYVAEKRPRVDSTHAHVFPRLPPEAC